MAADAETSAEQRQKEHFDKITSKYERHYDDPCSRRYREIFMLRPMLKGLDLSGSNVLEGMCGSGQATEYLLSRGAKVTGLDISRDGINRFRARFPQCRAVCASMADSGLKDNFFDIAVIVSGLHHMHPRVHETVDEIHRVLKPDGWFCFVEPHKGSWPDAIRSAWYRRDNYFEDNEAAIDLAELKQRSAFCFEFVRETYAGNIAYALVLQSLILRIPLGVKRFYTPVLLPLESLLQRFQRPRLASFMVGQWRKKSPLG